MINWPQFGAKERCRQGIPSLQSLALFVRSSSAVIKLRFPLASNGYEWWPTRLMSWVLVFVDLYAAVYKQHLDVHSKCSKAHSCLKLLSRLCCHCTFDQTQCTDCN